MNDKCPLRELTKQTEEDRDIYKKALAIAARKTEEAFLTSPLYAKHAGDTEYWKSMALGRWNCVQREIDAIRLERGLPVRQA